MLDQLYELRDRTAVAGFLRMNPGLATLLLAARDAIDRHFGPGQTVALEVVSDPETADDQQLVAWIQTALDAPEADRKLGALDRAWWFDALAASGGRLCITLEFT